MKKLTFDELEYELCGLTPAQIEELRKKCNADMFAHESERRNIATIDNVRAIANSRQCSGLVLYECGLMDSSAYGMRRLLTCGPDNTLKFPEEADKFMPWIEPTGNCSERMHAVAYWRKE